MSTVLAITRNRTKPQLLSTFSIASAYYYYYYCWSVTSTTASFTTTSFIKPSFVQKRVLLLHSTASSLSKLYSTTSSMSSSDSTTTPNRRAPHVVVVGSANYDMTVYTTAIPHLGETVLGEKFQTSCGGKGANQAIAAACLNNSQTSIVCRVGNDVFGQSLITNFQKHHVNINTESCIIKSDNDTTSEIHSSGVACITVDTTSGDNCIIVAPGANAQLSPTNVREQLLKLQPSVILVQLEIPYTSALEALKIGKQELGAITIFNPAPAPNDCSLLDDFYQYIDIIVPNESELRTLCGGVVTTESNDNNNEVEMAKRLLQKGIDRAVIVTLGARGAMVVNRDTNESNDSMTATTTFCSQASDLPCRDDPIIDTIGAGDGFCGALASYLSSGMITDLAKATELSCGLASMSIRRSGASYPSRPEIPDCLRITPTSPTTTGSSLVPTKPILTFVTGNKNKLLEVQAILSQGATNLPFELRNEKIDLPELQGNDTITIAIEKCKLAAQQCTSGGAIITEDTSLCFNALQGMPGPYIKWFLENCGHLGLNTMLDGFTDRTAYALTVVAYTAGPNSDVHVFDGRTDGTIVLPRGSLDFGWDPIFQPFEYDGTRTYAEMSKDEKNAISHRSRAFAKLRDFLLQQQQQQ